MDSRGWSILKEPDDFDKTPLAVIDAFGEPELVLYILSASLKPVIRIPLSCVTIVPLVPAPGFCVGIPCVTYACWKMFMDGWRDEDEE